MTVQMSDNVVHDNDAPSWRIVWNPLWPFGPSAKTKRIRELERQLRTVDAVAKQAKQALERVEQLGNQLIRERQTWEDQRREGQKQNAWLLAERNRLNDVLRVRESQLEEMGARLTGFTDKLLDSFVTLRRDGFNPMSAAIDAWNHSNPAPGQVPPVEAKLDTDWLEIVEAAQDRGGGDPKLYSKLIADAQRWRAKGISYKEIVKRIYEGFET